MSAASKRAPVNEDAVTPAMLQLRAVMPQGTGSD
eukprot:CAMPEP_0194537560 /NCGR_PEP_ID=MMETSP0253-20130528/76869_1 /TAXON_ID=2966 /ORGANISM="Noctiluca scintillans" /LENGTH=33 /DNA_ID= /DNA_START= /DNA_END= /DNA_ORIENTATION=